MTGEVQLTQVNDSYESLLISEPKPYGATNVVQTIPERTILISRFSSVKKIILQDNLFQQIPKWMILKSQLLLVSQNHIEQPMQFKRFPNKLFFTSQTYTSYIYVTLIYY